jgi:hypothetical protein
MAFCHPHYRMASIESLFAIVRNELCFTPFDIKERFCLVSNTEKRLQKCHKTNRHLQTHKISTRSSLRSDIVWETKKEAHKFLRNET